MITTPERSAHGPAAAEQDMAVPPPVRAGQTNPWVVLILVCAAQFMVVLDATVVNVALPSIKTGLGFSATDLQWVVNSYTLVFGGFLLLGGRAADLAGRQRLFLAGLAVFSVASLVNGLSQSAGMLVAGRALQGLGGALVSPAALAIITTTFAEGRERTKALGIWSAIAAGGGAFGLLLGGVLTSAFSWQWVFFVNVPIGILAFVLALRFVPNTRSEGARGGVDIAGALTVTGGLVLLVYAIVEGQSSGWLTSRTLVLAGVAIALLVSFVIIEARYEHPLIRLGIFRVRSLVGADVVLLLTAGGLFSMFFFASIYVQNVLGYSPVRAGLAFLPVTVGIAAGAGLAQGLIIRLGVRAVALGGLTLGAVGLVLLSRIPVDGGYVADLLPGLAVMSLGMGLTFVPITLIATTNVDAADAGLASGLLNTAQQVGGALGLAILSTVAADRTAGVLDGLGHAPRPGDQARALVDGFQVAFVGSAVMLATAVVLLAVIVRGRHVTTVTAGSPAPVVEAA